MIKRILLAALLFASGSAEAQLLTKFGPVNGILVGSSTSNPQTAAAVASNIYGLFGCSGGTQFLNGAGGCTSPAGTGVSSVGLTVAGSWYTVTGSPVTSSGTLAAGLTTGLTANQVLATPNGSTGVVGLRALVGADIAPINLASTANGGVLSTSILLGTNGGTSNGFFSVTGPTTALRTFTFPNASATVLTTNAAVTVPQGGTGAVAFTAHGVVVGEGTSALSGLAAMGADTVLQGQAGADPAPLTLPNCGSSTQAVSYSTSTHTFGCQTISSGTGSVTSVTAGTGLTASPNPIIATGTVSLDLTANDTWTGTHTFSLAPVFPAGFVGTGGTVNSSINGGIINANAGTAALAQFTASNGTNATVFGITGTGYTGTLFTGAPTGQFGFIQGPSSTSFPLSISVGSNEVVRIKGGGSFANGFALHGPSGVNQLAFAGLNNNGSSCSVGGDNFGISSCTRTGAGAITANFTNATATSAAVCVVTAVGIGTVTTATIVGGGTTSVAFQTYNLAGTAADVNTNLICF